MASQPCPHCDGTIGVTSPDTCYKCGRSVFSKPTTAAGDNVPNAIVIKNDTTDVDINLPSWLSPRAAPSLNMPQDRPLPPPPSEPNPQTQSHSLSNTQNTTSRTRLKTTRGNYRSSSCRALPKLLNAGHGANTGLRMIDPSKLTQNALF